jgi:hypothetical protein
MSFNKVALYILISIFSLWGLMIVLICSKIIYDSCEEKNKEDEKNKEEETISTNVSQKEKQIEVELIPNDLSVVL